MSATPGPFLYDANGNMTRAVQNCGADLNGDLVVTTPDMTILLASMNNQPADMRGDINLDGIVNTADLTALLGQFGKQCEYTQYKYDDRNQMVSAARYGVYDLDDDGEIDDYGPITHEYGYDALGRRLSKKLAGVSTDHTRFIYGGVG
ncbi:MAG: hypothetical protein J0L61_10600 [Planctomycetes bacterium]|nr:hypothetical protein [Planctomycetota bacterium]